MQSLAKTRLEYLLVTEIKILDEDDNVIDEMPNLPFSLQPGAIFEFTKLLVGKPQAEAFSFIIVDPNRNNEKDSSRGRRLKPTKIKAVLNTAVKNHIQQMKDDFSVKGNSSPI